VKSVNQTCRWRLRTARLVAQTLHWEGERVLAIGKQAHLMRGETGAQGPSQIAR